MYEGMERADYCIRFLFIYQYKTDVHMCIICVLKNIGAIEQVFFFDVTVTHTLPQRETLVRIPWWLFAL